MRSPGTVAGGSVFPSAVFGEVEACDGGGGLGSVLMTSTGFDDGHCEERTEDEEEMKKRRIKHYQQSVNRIGEEANMV